MLPEGEQNNNFTKGDFGPLSFCALRPSLITPLLDPKMVFFGWENRLANRAEGNLLRTTPLMDPKMNDFGSENRIANLTDGHLL